jgi:hypothetical protein
MLQTTSHSYAERLDPDFEGCLRTTTDKRTPPLTTPHTSRVLSPPVRISGPFRSSATAIIGPGRMRNDSRRLTSSCVWNCAGDRCQLPNARGRFSAAT